MPNILPSLIDGSASYQTFLAILIALFLKLCCRCNVIAKAVLYLQQRFI